MIYFAHCMVDYGTEREAKALQMMARFWPDRHVLNPACSTVQNNYSEWRKSVHMDEDPMIFFRGLVDDCDELAFMPLNKAHWPGYATPPVPPGVAAEVLEALVWDKPVWTVHPEMGLRSTVKCMPRHVLTIEETRRYIKEHTT